MWRHTPRIRELFSTIVSPEFSELVVVFSEGEAHCPSGDLACALREMHEIKEFRVLFCLETLEELRVSSLHRLTLQARAATVAGAYNFLPRPPLVFSRTVTKYDRFKSSVGVMYERQAVP